MSLFGERQSTRRRALTDRFLQFNRKFVSMQGPQTDELVQSGKIITPYPKTISTHYFPLRPRNEEALAVLVPDIEAIEAWKLSRPTFEQAIRFISQLKTGDVHEKKTLVFPSDPPFSGEDVEPPIPCWLTLAWRPERKCSELCLYLIEGRESWPENTFVVGFVAL